MEELQQLHPERYHRKVELRTHELTYNMAEEIKRLRTSICFAGDDKKVLLMTSSISHEGKSTLSLEIARSLTEVGRHVLLVDADMRLSQMKIRLESGQMRIGLSHYLSGQNTLQEALYETEKTNLYLIPAGRRPPNPAELLASKRFGNMIAEARKAFDYVIVDCPPLGEVVDAAVASQFCDASILVIESGVIHRQMAKNVVEKLKNARCPVLGVVLNKVKRQRGTRYGYGYGYGYDDLEDTEEMLENSAPPTPQVEKGKALKRR